MFKKTTYSVRFSGNLRKKSIKYSVKGLGYADLPVIGLNLFNYNQID